MAVPSTIPPREAADRPAVRERIGAHARCANRPAAERRKVSFTKETRHVGHMDAESGHPAPDPRTRDTSA